MALRDLSNSQRDMILARRIASIFLCFLILAVTIPNMGHINLATDKIYYEWQDLLWPTFVLIPMILILTGINRSKILESIGWAWLSITLAMVLSE